MMVSVDGNELHEGTGANVRFAGPDKKTPVHQKTSYIVSAGAVFTVQMLSQGFKGRAK